MSITEPRPPDIIHDISYDILEQHRTQNLTDILPFYNIHTKKLSSKLWIPQNLTENEHHFTDHLDIYNHDKNKSFNVDNIVINKSIEPIEFKTYKQKYSQSKDINNEQSQRSIKFPIFFNTNVRSFIDLQFDAYETYYNLSIDEINNRYKTKKTEFDTSIKCIYKKINKEKQSTDSGIKIPKKDLKIASIETCSNNKCENSWFCDIHKEANPYWDLNICDDSLRQKLILKKEELNKLNDNHELKKFANSLYEVRDQAIKSAIVAYKSALANLKNGNIKKFELKNKDTSKKYRKRQFECTGSAIKYINHELTLGTYTFYKFCKSNNISKSKPVISLKRDAIEWLDKNYQSKQFKIFRTCSGKYFIIFQTQLEKIINTNKSKIISIDPGVRSFITGYDPSGTIIETYDEYIYRIKDNYKRIDLNNSILSKKDKLKLSSKKYKKLKRMNNKKYNKIKNIVDDMHNKVSNYLTSNYDTILYSPLEVKNIIKGYKASLPDGARTQRGISKRVRLLNSLSFFVFKNKLISQAEKHNTKLYLVTEAYTSKTCSNCGLLNDKLKGNKRFKCSKCNLDIDRDHNGARNILLKHIECA